MIKWRRLIAKSWLMSKVHYRLLGLSIDGEPGDDVWYFAYGANMHDDAFLGRRGMRPLEWRAGCVNSKSCNAEDKKADAMLIAAIDVLLAYNGAI